MRGREDCAFEHAGGVAMVVMIDHTKTQLNNAEFQVQPARLDLQATQAYHDRYYSKNI
jgi:hypothetical protein